jgi:hypothetical protein
MSKLNLMLHAGARPVSREELYGVQTPEATKTWHPVPHHLMFEEVTRQLTNAGATVVAEAHGLLGKDGGKYFGMVQIGDPARPDGDYGLVIGVRNSHDQSWPGAIALGNGVFVCDNLSFYGEVQLARKHTRWFMRDMPRLVSTAVGKLIEKRQQQDLRITRYRCSEITNTIANDIIVNAMLAGVIGGQKLPAVVQEWRQPRHDEFKERTAWSLFNAFTEVAKTQSVEAMPQRTAALYGVFDSYFNLALGA